MRTRSGLLSSLLNALAVAAVVVLSRWLGSLVRCGGGYEVSVCGAAVSGPSVVDLLDVSHKRQICLGMADLAVYAEFSR